MTRFQSPARSLPPSGSGSTSRDPASLDSTSYTTQPALLVGIDWADGEHAYATLDPQGSLVRGTVQQTSQAIAQLIPSSSATGSKSSQITASISASNPHAVAPLTVQSGKLRCVHSRWACSKFLRQIFHEFAGVSITHGGWAKTFYDQQLARGKSASVAKRALAYKWIRILFRWWQDRKPYNEALYVQRLKANQSPLADIIAA